MNQKQTTLYSIQNIIQQYHKVLSLKQFYSNRGKYNTTAVCKYNTVYKCKLSNASPNLLFCDGDVINRLSSFADPRKIAHLFNMKPLRTKKLLLKSCLHFFSLLSSH